MISKSLPKYKVENGGRYENIAFIKTIMMVCVVLCHATAFFTGNWFNVYVPAFDANYLGILSNFLGTFHIQAFAMASGFLFYYLWTEKDRYNEPRKDIKKRAKRLLIPYLFTSILWVIPIGMLFSKYSFNEIISKFVLMTGPAQLWFLIMLFVVFIFFELIGKKIKLSFKNLVLVFIITTLLGGLLSIAHLNYFQLAVSVKYILFFYLGGYIYKYRKKITWKQTIVIMLAAVTLYIVTKCLGNTDTKIIKYGVEFIKPLMSALEVSTIYFFCSRLISRFKGITKNRFYRLLEGNSFGIYLFHQQIIYFTIAWFNGLVHPIVQAVLSFVIALVISLFMSWVLKKWRVTRWMFGL